MRYSRPARVTRELLADLEKLGLMEKIEPHVLPLAKCDRSGDIGGGPHR